MNTDFHRRFVRFLTTVLAILVLVSVLVIVPSPAKAETQPVTIFGPVTVERATGKPVNTTYRVVLSPYVGGPFTLKIQNGTNGSHQVTSATVKVNGVIVLKQSDFKKKKWSYLERQVNLGPVNSIEIAVDAMSKPGSRIKITLVGIDTTPEEIVLAEERGEIGPGGGILTLPNVGEIELVEDETRSNANIAVRKLQAPHAQERFAFDLLSEPTITYIDSIFEIQSDIPIGTNSAVRVVVPEAFANALPADQTVDLYMLLDDGEGLSFVSLNALYDPATGFATATLPPWAWREKEEATALQDGVSAFTAFQGVLSVAAAPALSYISWIQLASANRGTDGITGGEFYTISGNGAELPVQGNERLSIDVRAEVIGRGTLQTPFSGSPAVTTNFSGGHPGVDYDTNDNDQILAAHDGVVRYQYSTSTYACRVTNSDPGEDPDGTTLTGYGYSATVTRYDIGFPPRVLYTTRYAHLIPGSAQVADYGFVYQGTAIGLGGHSGCSSGSHLHFEYWRGTLAKEDPRLYYPSGTASNADQFKIGFSFNGRALAYSEVSLNPGQIRYTLPLDLTRERVVAGGRYPLELVLIDPTGGRHRLDWSTVVVQVVPLRVTLRWDKNDTDVDTHVYDSIGNHSWYRNLCGIPNACLDRDDVDGFGPEVFTLTNAPTGMAYIVKLHYYSDHGNGPTTATVVVEVNGTVVTNTSVNLINNQSVDIGTYTPNP